LKILDAIQDLNADDGVQLAVRAAVATGEAVVSLDARAEMGEGIATGDVVNTAARLQQSAPVGSVVVGESTYRSTRDVILYDELEPVTAKGKAEPLQLWQATRPRGRFGVDVERRADVPFTAWQRFLEAVAAQRPLVLVVEDLHWADAALVEFLDHLVDWASGVPLVLLVAARPEVYERHPGWGGGKRNSVTISLGPLSDEETARLV